MRVVLLLALLGCDRPELDAAHRGAKEPVFCLHNTPKFRDAFWCKDSDARYWICTGGDCWPIDYANQIFSQVPR